MRQISQASAVALWVLVLLSLALQGIFLAGIWKARHTALDILDQSLEALARLEDETFATTVHVQETVPVRVDIPFRREFEIPVSASVPISHSVSFHETFEILVDTPQGTQAVKVPISATIPLSLTIPVVAKVPVTISETIPIDTDIEIDAKVPVAIKIADTPLLSHLERFKTLLAEVRQQLSLGQ